MIVRVFRAVVHEGAQGEFETFFREQAVPLLRSCEGLLDLSIGGPLDGSGTEFLMITRWRDLDALRGFAGERWDEAVIDPAEAHLLKETHVHHYECLDA